MTFEEWISDKEFTNYIEECEYYALQKLCFEAGYEEGKKDKWHYTSENDYPPLKELPNGETYNPIVIVFWYNYDDYGKGSRVFDLDRWCPELKKWEIHEKDNIVAWSYMPEVSGVKR